MDELSTSWGEIFSHARGIGSEYLDARNALVSQRWVVDHRDLVEHTVDTEFDEQALWQRLEVNVARIHA